MSEKRKRDQPDDHTNKKRQKRGGFSVGPANLPDGIHKRKVQKIKQNLIEKAKIRKDYAKVKKQDETLPVPASLQEVAQEEDENEQPTTTPHPDRQQLMETEPEEPEERDSRDRRRKRPKAVPFKKEYDQAQKRKAEAEERRKAREEAERERQRKIEERERFRKAMAKARSGGPNGQRKLGRESTVLLEKVKRMVGQ